MVYNFSRVFKLSCVIIFGPPRGPFAGAAIGCTSTPKTRRRGATSRFYNHGHSTSVGNDVSAYIVQWAPGGARTVRCGFVQDYWTAAVNRSETSRVVETAERPNELVPDLFVAVNRKKGPPRWNQDPLRLIQLRELLKFTTCYFQIY